MHPGLESLISELIFGPELDLNQAAQVTRLLDRHELDASDREALSPEELRRLTRYRKLVRDRLQEAIEVQMPHTWQGLGARVEPWFDRFLAERGPQTHYLRDVALEFLDFVAPHWSEGGEISLFWLELGRHEALHVEVAAMPPAQRPAHEEPAQLSLDAGFEFCEAARLVRYQYAVHRIEEAPERVPEPCSTALLAYRDAEHEVRFLELSPLATSLLDQLLQGSALGAALVQAAAQHQSALDEDVLEQCSQLLADLSERGVILAPRALAHPPSPSFASRSV